MKVGERNDFKILNFVQDEKIFNKKCGSKQKSLKIFYQIEMILYK